MSEETNILYSDKYFDDKYEYRHVMLPADVAELVPRNHLMTETEWRNLGVQQSPYWTHYMVHSPVKDEKLTKEKEIKDLEEKCLQMQENTSVKKNIFGNKTTLQYRIRNDA
ncbi:cyclin-dependent kinases regulatory subunit-like [Uloborus diversus]|uniref:cyclin-dependent kinases regulatory subunit-like n=1 Tax=Uloborus diversus TaxID=327109 RepID=UPI002409873E|nr:cyclin-dependent kinases regulatory subunit-like [Uloborus diversus]